MHLFKDLSILDAITYYLTFEKRRVVDLELELAR